MGAFGKRFVSMEDESSRCSAPVMARAGGPECGLLSVARQATTWHVEKMPRRTRCGGRRSRMQNDWVLPGCAVAIENALLALMMIPMTRGAAAFLLRAVHVFSFFYSAILGRATASATPVLTCTSGQFSCGEEPCRQARRAYTCVKVTKLIGI